VSLRNQQPIQTSNVVCDIALMQGRKAALLRGRDAVVQKARHVGLCRAIMCYQACLASLVSPGRQAAPRPLCVRTADCLNQQPSALQLVKTTSLTSDLATFSFAPTTSPTATIHDIRAPGERASRRALPVSTSPAGFEALLYPFLPHAHTDVYTALCDCYTLQTMGGSA
jgi:hypothetical protein